MIKELDNNTIISGTYSWQLSEMIARGEDGTGRLFFLIFFVCFVSAFFLSMYGVLFSLFFFSNFISRKASGSQLIITIGNPFLKTINGLDDPAPKAPDQETMTQGSLV